MNKYKVIFWCLVFLLYLFIMWFVAPSALMDGRGEEVSYLFAVFFSHAATVFVLSLVFILGWSANKVGY